MEDLDYSEWTACEVHGHNFVTSVVQTDQCSDREDMVYHCTDCGEVFVDEKDCLC